MLHSLILSLNFLLFVQNSI